MATHARPCYSAYDGLPLKRQTISFFKIFDRILLILLPMVDHLKPLKMVIFENKRVNEERENDKKKAKIVHTKKNR